MLAVSLSAVAAWVRANVAPVFGRDLLLVCFSFNFFFLPLLEHDRKSHFLLHAPCLAKHGWILGRTTTPAVHPTNSSSSARDHHPHSSHGYFEA